VSGALRRLTAVSPARRQACKEQETELVPDEKWQEAAGREGQGSRGWSPLLPSAKH